MSMPIDLFNRLTAKTKWANKQIDDLQIALGKAFPGGHSDQYKIRSDDDMNARERSYYVTRVPDVPLEIRLRAGDILNNLRCSLDHLACHLVWKNGGTVTSNTGFPIANSAKEYLSPRVRGKVKGMRQDAIDAIDVIEPYAGGKGTILWRIARLNNRDKHRLLLTACSTQTAHRATPSDRKRMEDIFRGSHPGEPVPELRGHFIGQHTYIPLKAGHKLLTVPHVELEQYMQFLIDVSFDEPEIVECRPILPLLHEMSTMVLTPLPDSIA